LISSTTRKGQCVKSWRETRYSIVDTERSWKKRTPISIQAMHHKLKREKNVVALTLTIVETNKKRLKMPDKKID
jgi:hypothetical protein